MKRIWALILGAALLLSAVTAAAEGAEVSFGELSGLIWEFSSGAGGWSAGLRIGEDGSFTGDFHDSEMGDMGEEYPNGTIYCCSFSGRIDRKSVV